MKRSSSNSMKPRSAVFESQTKPYTEAGNAERFLLAFGPDHLYCPERRCWYYWDGRHRWVPDYEQRVMTTMLACVRNIRRTLPHLDARDLQDALRHLVRSETAKSLKGALEIAAAQCCVPAKMLDADLMLLNVQNGTLDLCTGELREAKREDRITRVAPVKFDADACSPDLADYLEHVTGGDRAYQAYLGRALGYSLTGMTTEDVCFLLLGSTRTGKTTFLELLRAMLGDYSCGIPFEALLQRERGRGGPRPELAGCDGRRVVTASEVAEGRTFDAATLKALTGGDEIVVRGMYERPFPMKPSFKLWLAANAAPELPNADSASRERLRVLPFTHCFEEPDTTMRARLQSASARAAALAFAVRGLAEFRQSGLGSCEAVETATATYWDGSESDSKERVLLDRFFASHTLPEPEAVTSSKELQVALAALAQVAEMRCPSPRRLASALRALGFEPHRDARVRGWRGLRLVQAPDLAGDGVTR